MAIYQVQNQWGGNTAPWHPGGAWVLGCRDNQEVVAIQIKSSDKGKTFTGTMTYAGEGPIGVKATQVTGNNYSVENQWGGSTAPWNPGGNWVIGGRDTKPCIALDVKGKEGKLDGTMTYEGEGPIGFKGALQPGASYLTKNQWGGNTAPWHPGGTFVLGARENQNPVNFDLSSSDHGKTLTGTMTYNGEGPIGFKGAQSIGNTYDVQNQWGGSTAPWHPGGEFIIGCRSGQLVVALQISSKDGGKTFSGTMTYDGEGPIGFEGSLSTC